MSSKARACTYCDQPATTRDHVPPKNLFEPPRPQLITVPSCAACNKGASLDDEYFPTVVALRHDLDSPEGDWVRASAMRSFQRPQGRGLLSSLLLGAGTTEVTSPAGLYLGRATTYPVDNERLDRVVLRTTLGLLYDETGSKLPNGYAATAYLLRARQTINDWIQGTGL